jgi:ASC-1-like (ASCH) protein
LNTYPLEIYRLPLEAIEAGSKKVEIRTLNSYESLPYAQLLAGDRIHFQIIAGPPFVGLDVIEPDALLVEVVKVVHYPTPRELLLAEGLEVLSGLCDNLDDGEKLLYSFHEYERQIPIHGIFAIHIRPLELA